MSIITYDYVAAQLVYTSSGPLMFQQPVDFSGSIGLGAPLGDNLSNTQVTPLQFDFGGFNSAAYTTDGFIAQSFRFSTDAHGAITAWDVSFSHSWGVGSTAHGYADGRLTTVDDQFTGLQTYASCGPPGGNPASYGCAFVQASSAPGHWKLEAPEISASGIGSGLTVLCILAILAARREVKP